jgi:hypothetical protein
MTAAEEYGCRGLWSRRSACGLLRCVPGVALPTAARRQRLGSRSAARTAAQRPSPADYPRRPSPAAPATARSAGPSASLRARPIAAMGKSRATYYRQHRQSPAAPRPSRERAGQPPLDKDRPPQCSGASISRWLLVHSRGKPSLALKFLATAEARTQSRTSRGPAPRTSMLYESSVLSSSTW